MQNYTYLALFVFISVQVCAGVFSGDPPDKNHPWAVHDENRPQPPVVQAGEKPGDPPSSHEHRLEAIGVLTSAEMEPGSEQYAQATHHTRDVVHRLVWIHAEDGGMGMIIVSM